MKTFRPQAVNFFLVGFLTVVTLVTFQNCGGVNSSQTLSGSETTASSVDNSQIQNGGAVPSGNSGTSSGSMAVSGAPVFVQNPNPADFQCSVLAAYVSCRNAPLADNLLATEAVKIAVSKPNENGLCVYVKDAADAGVNLKCVITANLLAPVNFLYSSRAAFSNIYAKLRLIVSAQNARCYGMVSNRVGYAAFATGSHVELVEYSCEVLNNNSAAALAELNSYFSTVTGGSIPNTSTGLTMNYGNFALTCSLDPNPVLGVGGKSYIKCSGNAPISQM